MSSLNIVHAKQSASLLERITVMIERFLLSYSQPTVDHGIDLLDPSIPFKISMLQHHQTLQKGGSDIAKKMAIYLLPQMLTSNILMIDGLGGYFKSSEIIIDQATNNFIYINSFPFPVKVVAIHTQLRLTKQDQADRSLTVNVKAGNITESENGLEFNDTETIVNDFFVNHNSKTQIVGVNNIKNIKITVKDKDLEMDDNSTLFIKVECEIPELEYTNNGKYEFSFISDAQLYNAVVNQITNPVTWLYLHSAFG